MYTRNLAKKLLLFSCIALIVLFALGFAAYLYRIEISEAAYSLRPDSANLIDLSIKLIGTGDYDRMTKYLPMAAELDDFLEVSRSRRLFIHSRSNQDTEYAIIETQKDIIVESALSFIHAKRYEEFKAYFPKVLKRIIMDKAIPNWMDSIKKSNDISQEGYETILEVLDQHTPLRLEVRVENRQNLIEYSQITTMKIPVCMKLGDSNLLEKYERDNEQNLSDLVKTHAS